MKGVLEDVCGTAEKQLPVVATGLGATGTGLGATGTGLGDTGTGLGATGTGLGATGTGLGATGTGKGATGTGIGAGGCPLRGTLLVATPHVGTATTLPSTLFLISLLVLSL